jgi:uncharacterized membrane protein YgcG
MVPQCQGCGFSIRDLDKKLRRLPKRSGFVNDFAQMLSDEEKAQLEERLEQFHQKTQGEMVLVTAPKTKPVKPSEYVFWLFNRWKVGGENHAGVMLLLAQKERRIESEVGYSWEHIISDVESGKILDETVAPLLREGKMFEGLLKGTEQLTAILEGAITPPAQPPGE